MSNPNRRPNPTIPRGKKGDKRKDKRLKKSENRDSAPNNDLGTFFGGEEKRKAMIINKNSTDEDKKYLSDPSPRFYKDTALICDKNRKNDTELININATNFETGIKIDKTKKERMLVLNGRKPEVFKELLKVFRERKNEILQEKIKSNDSILENNVEQEKKNRQVVAEENQKLLDRTKVKQEVELLPPIELKNQQEEIGKVILAEKEVEPLPPIELESRRDDGEKISLTNHNRSPLQRDEKPVKKKKRVAWTKLFKSLLSLISIKGKKSRHLLPHAKQLESTNGKLKTAGEGDPKTQLTTEISTGVPERIIEEEEKELEVLAEISSTDVPNIAIAEEGLPGKSSVLPMTNEIESSEVILAILRKEMRKSPSPINSMSTILRNRYGLSATNVNHLINHVVSPITICGILTDKKYETFIQYLNENRIDEDLDISARVIKMIGQSELNSEEKVDICNIFANEPNQTKIRKQVITIALLLNALPAKFEKWWRRGMIPKDMSDHYEKNHDFFLSKKWPLGAIEDARMLVCACAIEKPNFISRKYSFRKFRGGLKHENKSEKWLNGAYRDIQYLTEDQIKKGVKDNRYGGKRINSGRTPDILLKVPIQLCKGGGAIYWIDAKKHFVDPALSPDEDINSICEQMKKYVKHYGPGLIIWGKDFSEEWNVATEGAVQHIKV